MSRLRSCGSRRRACDGDWRDGRSCSDFGACLIAGGGFGGMLLAAGKAATVADLESTGRADSVDLVVFIANGGPTELAVLLKVDDGAVFSRGKRVGFARHLDGCSAGRGGKVIGCEMGER